MASRSASLTGPICDIGGRIHARSVTAGLPLASSSETAPRRLPARRSPARHRARIRAQRIGRRLHRPLVARRKCAQRVLDAVAELPEDGVGNVRRVMRHEIDADTFRADEPDDLLDLLDKRAGASVEQEMRLVEKKDELGLSGSPISGSRSKSSDSTQSRNVA